MTKAAAKKVRYRFNEDTRCGVCGEPILMTQRAAAHPCIETRICAAQHTTTVHALLLVAAEIDLRIPGEEVGRLFDDLQSKVRRDLQDHAECLKRVS